MRSARVVKELIQSVVPKSRLLPLVVSTEIDQYASCNLAYNTGRIPLIILRVAGAKIKGRIEKLNNVVRLVVGLWDWRRHVICFVVVLHA